MTPIGCADRGGGEATERGCGMGRLFTAGVAAAGLGAAASRLRGDAPGACQMKALSRAQADIITNCGSKNAVIAEWDKCRMPILERAQREIASICCLDDIGSSGCEDSSLPTEEYEMDSPGSTPPAGLSLGDSDA